MQLRTTARGLALAGSALMCAIILMADLGFPLPVRKVLALPLADKLGHFALFGLLGWLIIRAGVEARPSWPHARVAAACSAILIALAAAEEFSQRYISTRTFSLWDLAASAAGILAMAAVEVWASARNTRRPRLSVRDRRA